MVHKAVVAALKSSREPLWISTIGSGPESCSVVMAYSQSRPYPVWVAKISPNARMSSRLSREYTALESMRPWAQELNLPVPLAWDCDPDQACLILSGLAGSPESFTLIKESGMPHGLHRLELALSWLRRFRECVPVSAVERELDREQCVPLIPDPVFEGRPFLALCELLRDQRPQLPSVPSHGDFWRGNLLFDGPRVTVLDWDALGLRSPLHDLVSLFSSSGYLRDGRIRQQVDTARIVELFFSETAAALRTREIVSGLDTSPDDLQRAFYSFIRHRLRSGGSESRAIWSGILRVLHGHGFPAPWSCCLSAGV
ncbi:MAG: phosphotransferase [Bryobacteraceae bacterium]